MADGIELSGIGVPEAGEELTIEAEEFAMFSSSIFKISLYLQIYPSLSFKTLFFSFTNLDYLEWEQNR